MTLSFHDKIQLFEESAEHFIDVLARKDPTRTLTARKIIRQNLMKVKHAQTETNEVLRPDKEYTCLARASQIAFANNVSDAGRVRSWLKNGALNVLASGFIYTVVVLIAKGMEV